MSSVVVDTLKAIVPNKQVFSYKNEKDFLVLWGLDSPSGLTSFAERITRDVALEPQTIVVVWDGISAGNTYPVNTSDYLTPIDWAVALSLTIDRLVKKNALSGGQNIYPDLRILLLDISSHYAPNSPSVLFIRQFPKRAIMSMPWIRMFRLASVNKEALDTTNNEWDAQNLIDNLIPPSKGEKKQIFKTSSMSEAMKAGGDLDTLRRLWTTFLTKPAKADDHHALANLIGPMLLMGEPSRFEVNVRALKCLMESVGLLHEGKDNETLLREGKPWITELKGEGKPKFKLLLIDDQWKQGWGEFLCRAVGVPYTYHREDVVDLPQDGFTIIGSEGNIEIKAVDSAEKLVNWPLEYSEDQRFKLALDGEEGAQEILFLDLRLFSGKHISKEAGYILKLSKVARLFSDDNKKLPWTGFTNKELDEIDKWANEAIKEGALNNLRDNPRYHKALTLLPRILSLIDLSYPIVLFSSTGKRRIAEPLNSYRNIITHFGKPELSGISQDGYVGQMRDLFQAAMAAAFSILRARNRCQSFILIRNPYEGAIKFAPNMQKAYHVEFYMDEANPYDKKLKELEIIRGNISQIPKALRVGGCFAVFEGNTYYDAIKKADSFDNALVQEGIRYFKLNPNDKAVKIKGKNACHVELSNTLISHSKSAPLYFGISSLCQELHGGPITESVLLDIEHYDQLFLTTIASLIEAFCYEALQAIFGENVQNVSLSLFAGTRVNIIPNRIIARKEDYRAGVSWKPYGRKVMQYTFSKSDFAPLVRNVMAIRGQQRHIIRALAVQLCYQGEPIDKPEYFVCRQCEVMLKAEMDAPDQGAILCTNCKKSDNVYPDYRALHYVSDEILTDMFGDGNRNYGNIFGKLIPGEFEDSFDGFSDILAAGRALDRAIPDYSRAILDFPLNIERQIVINNGNEAIHKPAIRDFVRWRIGKSLADIDGANFIRIVNGLMD